MIKKYKSKLLGIFSISMLVAIPIIVTSCSTTTNSNTNSSEEKPIENPNDPIVKGDETNNDNFVPKTSDGLYVNLTNKLDSYFSWENNNILYGASQYSIRDVDVKDIIKMWSFNKWFTTKTLTNIKPMQSILENVISKKSENSTWNISFDYIFKLIVNENNKDIPVYVKKHYEGTTTSLSVTSNLTFNTSPIEIKINGYDALTNNNYSNTIKRILLFAREKSSNWKIDEIINTFFKNKNINGTLGLWKDTVKVPNGVYINDKKDSIKVDFSKFDDSTNWYGLDKNSTITNINSVLYKTIKKSNDNESNLSETFVNLITDKNKLIKSFNVHCKIENKITKFTIILSKEDKTIGHLELTFKNYK